MKTLSFRNVSSMFAAVAFFAGSSALAATASEDMAISATVTNSCTIAAGSLVFGAYDTSSATDNDQDGSFSINCTNGAVVNIMLGQGANSDAGSSDAAPLRRLKSGTRYLNYGLYQTAARSTVWGNTSATGKEFTGTGAAQSVAFYGRMPAGQSAASGSYTDTVTATVEF